MVEARSPVDPDAFRVLRFGSSGATQEVAVRVRHVTARRTAEGERYLVGLEFVDPSTAVLGHIDRIVEARLAEMRSVPEA